MADTQGVFLHSPQLVVCRCSDFVHEIGKGFTVLLLIVVKEKGRRSTKASSPGDLLAKIHAAVKTGNLLAQEDYMKEANQL